MRENLPITLGIFSLLGAILGAIVWHWFLTRVLPYRHRAYSWWFTIRIGWFTPYHHIKYGNACSTDRVLQRAGYALGYSNKRRCALWVSYVISKHSIGVDVERGESYRPDTDILERYRLTPEDCENSGYDKGHLAPSAAIDFSRESNDQTFLMSNVALQHPDLNRQAWGKLERLVRKWSFTKGKLAIVTGPIFGKRNKRYNKIPIPRFFYKVVYSLTHKRSIAFVLPNKAVENNELWNKEHVMSVRALEDFIRQANPTSKIQYSFLEALGSDANFIKGEVDISFWKDDPGWND